MSEAARVMNGCEYPELINHTRIPGVVRFRIDRETPCRTTIYDPAIYILAQGERWFMQAGEKSPYIESNCIDIYALLASCDIPYNNGPNTVFYAGVFLF